jgi:protein SCO1/2
MRLEFLLSFTMALSCALCLADEPAPHAHHRMVSADVRVSHASYDVPDVELRDEQGHPVRLRELLADDRPLAVNFIYTSCTTICPVMTATFLQLQKDLAADAKRPRFVSISIDPDLDTAPALRAYAERFGASWTFLTGTSSEVLGVLRAFDAWRGNKTNHVALTLLRAPHGGTWTRVEGLAPAEHLGHLWKDLESS